MKYFQLKIWIYLNLKDLDEIVASNGDVAERNGFFLGKNLVDLDKKSYFKLLLMKLPIHLMFSKSQVFSFGFTNIIIYTHYQSSSYLPCQVESPLYETHSNNEKLRQISRFHCKIKVWKNGEYIEIDSSELAPGHIVALDSSVETCPCDLILVKGDAIVDESMLTGESVPVSKVAFQSNSNAKSDFTLKNGSNMIFCGTKILRARDALNKPALGLVLKIGFETEKGQLIQSILFPKPINFNFYSDSIKYIMILGVIAILDSF